MSTFSSFIRAAANIPLWRMHLISNFCMLQEPGEQPVFMRSRLAHYIEDIYNIYEICMDDCAGLLTKGILILDQDKVSLAPVTLGLSRKEARAALAERDNFFSSLKKEFPPSHIRIFPFKKLDPDFLPTCIERLQNSRDIRKNRQRTTPWYEPTVR